MHFWIIFCFCFESHQQKLVSSSHDNWCFEIFVLTMFWIISDLGENGVKGCFLNINMSEKGSGNWYIFHSLLYISELWDLNMRNECIWIFLIYSEFVKLSFWITGYKNICIKKYNLNDMFEIKRYVELKLISSWFGNWCFEIFVLTMFWMNFRIMRNR